MTKALAENDFLSFWQNLIDKRLQSKNDALNSLAWAIFYLPIGKKEKALDSLEHSFNEHHMFLPKANADSVFDSQRTTIQKCNAKS